MTAESGGEEKCQCQNKEPGAIFTVKSLDPLICDVCNQEVKQQPAAESVKSCPLCGNPGKLVFWNSPQGPVECSKHDVYPSLDRAEWDNAWAHRRIADLEQEKSTLAENALTRSFKILARSFKIVELERRNAELEEQNMNEMRANIELHQRILNLEGQLKEANVNYQQYEMIIKELEQQVRELNDKTRIS